jgi:hypothetical protein
MCCTKAWYIHLKTALLKKCKIVTYTFTVFKLKWLKRYPESMQPAIKAPKFFALRAGRGAPAYVLTRAPNAEVTPLL